MTPEFGDVRVIEYAGVKVTVMALAHGPLPSSWVSDEGTHAFEGKVAVLVLACENGVPGPYYPLHGTATCRDDEWLEGEEPK